MHALNYLSDSAARSRAWVCGRSLAAIDDSNPAVVVSVVLSGRGLCVGPIPPESYRLWCV